MVDPEHVARRPDSSHHVEQEVQGDQKGLRVLNVDRNKDGQGYYL